MKKIIALILAVVTVFCFVSCGGQKNNPTDTSATTEGENTTSSDSSEATTAKKEKVTIDYNMDTVGQTIIDEISKNYPNNEHPRLIMTKERVAEVKSLISGQTAIGRAYRAVKKNANNYLSSTPLEYNIYDGIRLLNICRETQSAVMACSYAYLISGNKSFAEKACEWLDKAASYPDWNPYHFLDVGEMSLCFAIGYDWLYDYLTPERKALYAEKIMEYGVKQAMKDYENKLRQRSYKWYQDTPGDNWKFVCNGGIGLACMAVFDDVSEANKNICIKALTYGYKSNYEFVRNAYNEDDGSYVESMTYWEYATLFLGYYATALETAIGCTLDLLDWVGLEKTGVFCAMLSSNRHYSFAFGDSSSAFMLSSSFLWIGHELNLPQIAYLRYEYITKNLSYSLNDLLWLWSTDSYEEIELDTDFGAVGATNASFRSGWTDANAFCAVHFGKQSVPHSHSDTGEFIYVYQNVKFFIELGADNYNLNGYGVCYRHISEGHNTLTINPKETLSYGGQKSSAVNYITEYKSGDNESYAICDMTTCYTVESVVRGVKLIKDTNTMIVQDEIKCSATDDIYWFGHTAAQIKIADDKRSAILTQNNQSVKVTLLGDGELTTMVAASTSWSPSVSGQAENNATRLTVNCKGKTSYTIIVAVSPVDAPTPEVKALADWKS